jgi:sugar O-acyltransferase (sialic acid O-acetyltransferase NeuD family)
MAESIRVLVLGCGGHAKVLVDTLTLQGVCVLGCISATSGDHGTTLLGVPVLGGDERILEHSANSVLLVNGIGSISPGRNRRREIFEEWKGRGYSFHTVIHPSAIVASGVQLEEGVQLMAQSVIQPDTFIGANSIVNTRSSIDHDGWIGAHVHIAPGVTISGNVRIGDGVHLGIGAVVIQGIIVGENALVAAGAVVTNNVPKDVTVKGVPARAEGNPR